MSTTGFFLGVALDATPDLAADEILDSQLKAARQLDATGIDFLTLDDSFAQSDSGIGFDAELTASFLSSQTRQIGLVPTVTTTHIEPFHIATATATLDYSGRARAGWQASPSLDPTAAAAFGRREAAAPAAAWAETGQVIEVVRALWDSWENDAEIRDVRTGRFLDRGKVHYVDAVLTDSIGEPYSVKGPSIVPRPPQGHLPVFINVTDEHSRKVALRTADVILLPVPDAGVALTAVAALESELSSGREVRIIPSIPVPADAGRGWFRATATTLIDAGVDGLHLRPQVLGADVDKFAATVVDSAGAFGSHRQGTSLRDRLGLPVAANQFAG